MEPKRRTLKKARVVHQRYSFLYTVCRRLIGERTKVREARASVTCAKCLAANLAYEWDKEASLKGGAK